MITAVYFILLAGLFAFINLKTPKTSQPAKFTTYVLMWASVIASFVFAVTW